MPLYAFPFTECHLLQYIQLNRWNPRNSTKPPNAPSTTTSNCPPNQTRHEKPASLASPRHGRRSTHGQRLRRHAVHQRDRCQISRRCRRLKPLGGIGTEPNCRWCAAHGGTCVGSSGRVDSGEAGSENVTRGTD